jgi:excisionase family DNA binding protein
MLSDREHIPPAEFARRFSVSPVSVYRWIKAGKIPVVRLGKSVRIDPEAAVTALNDQQRKGAADGR